MSRVAAIPAATLTLIASATVAVARFLTDIAASIVRGPVSVVGDHACPRPDRFRSVAIVLACGLGCAPVVMACGDDTQCPRGTSGDPCRPDGPVGDPPVPGEITRPDVLTADIVDGGLLDAVVELSDITTDTPNDHEDNDAPDTGSPFTDGHTADDAGSDATDDAEDAAHDDVAPDSTTAVNPRARRPVFITTPNTRARPSPIGASCALSGLKFRVRAPHPDSRPPTRQHVNVSGFGLTVGR